MDLGLVERFSRAAIAAGAGFIHQLGVPYSLLWQGRFDEALGEYERSQVRDPNRLRSLYGAGLAAVQSGNREKAKYFYGRVAQLVGNSDSRPELKQVRDFLAGN